MRRGVIAAFLSALLALPGGAKAEDLKFITLAAAPWASIDKVSGKPVGVFPQLVEELERRTGFRIKQTLEPFARIDHELETGSQDCTIIVWSDARARIVERGELVSTHMLGVVGRKGLRLKSLEDLRGHTVSVLRGLAVGPKFDDDPAILKEYDADYLLGIRKLAHQRVDAVVGAVPTILYLARQEGVSQQMGTQLVLAELPLVLQCSKKSGHLDLMPSLNKAIRDMRDDGTMDHIKSENYFM